MGAGSDAMSLPTCGRGRRCEVRPDRAIAQAGPHLHPPPIPFGANFVRRANSIPSPSMGEGGGERRRRLDIDRFPPPRPSPARGEGAHAPCASLVPNSIDPPPWGGGPRRTHHGHSLSSSQEGCYEADGCVRGAVVFSPVSLARKWGMTYFPKRRREFITSAWVAGPAWKMGMISVAPISS
jgi:hypothetical protein